MMRTKLIRGQSGAALISVLLVSSMLLMLGATCVFASYVNAMMKETDRGARQNFYALEQEMDAKRGELLGYISDAIEEAFLIKLEHYDTPLGEGDTGEFDFENLFWKALIKNGEFLKLLGITEDPANVEFEDVFEWVPPDKRTQLRIRNDKIKLTTLANLTDKPGDSIQGHNFSDIMAGFTINVPSFTPARDGSPTRLKEFTIIAGGTLTNNGSTAKVVGNAYAGRILASGGSLAIGESDTEGTMYVADDLELEKSTSVTISGGYYGMGDDPTDAQKSSAILFNEPSGNTLNLSDATDMRVAGKGFIWNFPGGVNTPIPMGNTLTVKADQLAYLAPDGRSGRNISDSPKYMNPRLYSMTDAFPSETPDEFSEKARLKIAGCDGVETRIETQGTEQVFFDFLIFKDDSARRAYFNRYISASDTDASYVDSYAASLTVNENALFNGLAWLSNTPTLGGGDYAGEAARLKKLRVTLDDDAPNGAIGGATDPYHFYVLKESAAAGMEFTGPGGATAIFVADGAAISDYASYDIVVCMGSATSGDFKGLIIAKGDVKLVGATLTPADDATMMDLMDAVNEDGERLTDYLRLVWRSGDGAAVNWNAGELGKYSGWIKNRD